MNKMRRKMIGAGDTTTYKLPVIKGEEGKAFYKWFNKTDSINKLITEALKLKFVVDQLKLEGSEPRNDGKTSENACGNSRKSNDLDALDIIDESEIDLELLTRTLHSIKR